MRYDLTRDMVNESAVKRFWKRVNKRGKDECWEWTGAVSTVRKGVIQVYGGYGRFSVFVPWLNRNGAIYAHRIAYIIEHDCDIPAGMVIMHTCDNPPCCNPSHLRLGTYSENSQDRDDKGRTPSTRNGRPRGFILSESQIDEFARLYRSGMTTAEVALHFSVCTSTARKAVRISGVPMRSTGSRGEKKRIHGEFMT